MKRIYLLITLLFLAITYTNAQIYVDNQGNIYDERQQQTNTKNTVQAETKAGKTSKFDKNKLEFGGNLSFAIGNNIWGLGFSPQVGYKFSKYFSAGAGIGYSYYSEKSTYFYDYKYKEHYASFNLYGRFFPIKYIVFSVRPEIGRMWQHYEIRDENDKETGNYNKFIPSLVVGGGVKFGPVMVQINYDLVQDNHSSNNNDVFYSVGFVF